MEFALKNEVIDFEGTKLDNIMPPISIFGGKARKKELLAERLQEYFDKYRGLVYILKGDNYC